MARQQDPLTMDFLLLGIIDRKPTHAYDLYKQVTTSEELKTIWTFRQSRLYAVLDKIERSGLINTEIEPGDTLPNRKICTLTPIGKATFEKWLHSPVDHMNEIRSDFLGKLYFLKDRPKEEMQQLVHEQIKSCEHWLSNIEKKLSEHPDAHDYLHIVYSFRAEFIQATLSWLATIN